MIGILYNVKTAYNLIQEINRNTKRVYSVILIFQIITSYACVFLKEYTQAAIIFYLAWINTIALVDYYTGYVYAKMKNMIYIPVAMCIILLFLCDNGYVYIIEISSIFFVCMVLLKFMEKTCGLGGGDVDVLLIGTIFISFFKIYKTTADVNNIIHIVYGCLITNFAIFSVAGLLFAVRYIFSVDLKKFILKDNKPFVPSIYMASVLYYILHFY